MQFRVVFYHLRYVQYGFARNIATSSNNRGGFFRYSNEDIRIKQRVQINYGLPPPTNQKIGKRKTLLANRLTPPPLAFAPLPVSLHSRIFFFRLYEITMDLGGDAGVIFACRGGGGGAIRSKCTAAHTMNSSTWLCKRRQSREGGSSQAGVVVAFADKSAWGAFSPGSQ